MFKEILSKIAAHFTRLVAVSKTQPPERILEIYRQGQRIFGENRPQELLAKKPVLPPDIEWHLIGHLQTNKVKSVVPHTALIHSVDSPRLLAEIDKQAKALGKIQDCLLQFHIASEETKFGLSETEANDLLQSPEFQQFKNVRIVGVMGMATFTENPEQVRREFRCLRQIFDNLKQAFFPADESFREISMGMSGDWEIALEEGATLVRIGSLIFG